MTETELNSEETSGNIIAARQMTAKQMEALMRSAAFGDIVGILMRAPKHKKLTLDALRIFILPALIHDQYMIARVRQQNKGGSVAAGVAIWASVSDAIDQRLRSNPNERLKLSHDEWRSGDNLWLIEFIAPSPIAGSMLKDLDEKVAKGRPMAAQVTSKDSSVQITTVKDLLSSIRTKEAANDRSKSTKA